MVGRGDAMESVAEFALNRMSICRSCEELVKELPVCKQCGCFMPLKTKIEESTCPLGKW